jgi:hypothetical protein
VNYSDLLDEYILCSDSTYDHELNDYIFSEEKSSNNDAERIERRREEIARRKQERLKREAQHEKEYAERMAREESTTLSGEPTLGGVPMNLDELVSHYSQNLTRDIDGGMGIGTSGIFDMIRRSTPSSRRSRRSDPTPEPEPEPVSGEIPEFGYEETYDDLPF